MIPLRILWRTGTFVSVKTTPKNIYKQGSICAKFLEENHQNQFKVQFFTTATNFMNKNKGKSSISISPNNKSALFLYKCPKCNFCHEDKFKIKNHLKVVHQAKPYFCQKCSEEFTSFAKLLSHIKSKHKRFPVPKEPYELQEFGPKIPEDSSKVSAVDISKKENTNILETVETLCTFKENVNELNHMEIKEQKKSNAISEVISNVSYKKELEVPQDSGICQSSEDISKKDNTTTDIVDEHAEIQEQKKVNAIMTENNKSNVYEEKRLSEIKTDLILSKNNNQFIELLDPTHQIKKKADISLVLGWFNFASIFGIGLYLVYQHYFFHETKTLHNEKSIDETDYSFNNIIPKEEQENDKDVLKKYKMSADPRGLALIIDIEEFDDFESPSSKCQDISELKLLFHKLKLTCIHEKNLKSNQLYEVIDSFSSNPEHAQADMMVLVILSQGVSDKICSTNGSVNTELIYEKFNNLNCPNLAGKPKLFIMDVSRINDENVNYQNYIWASSINQISIGIGIAVCGLWNFLFYPITRLAAPYLLLPEDKPSSDDTSSQNSQTGKNSDTNLTVKTEKPVPEEDMIIAFATSNYNQRLQSPSSFIHSLVQVFQKYSSEKELIDMLRIAQKNYYEDVSINRGFDLDAINVDIVLRSVSKSILFN